MVERIADGQAAANTLSRLLSVKDEAHYGLFDVSAPGLKAALRQAAQLVEFASKVLRR